MPNREFTPSSGNVFADLNLPRADDLLAKAELAAKIIAEIQRRRLTQGQAAAILGIDQPKVSALKQGKLSGFSRLGMLATLVPAGCTAKGDRTGVAATRRDELEPTGGRPAGTAAASSTSHEQCHPACLWPTACFARWTGREAYPTPHKPWATRRPATRPTSRVHRYQLRPRSWFPSGYRPTKYPRHSRQKSR